MTVKYLILGLYFLILFMIGIVASRRIRGIKDYYVGGKALGYWVVAFSSRATGESAWLLLGLTGMGAAVGVSAFWVVVGELLGVAVAWFLMAKPFKRLSDEYDSITIPDYLSSRFGSTTNLLRGVAATVLSLFVIIYVSAQIDATGKAFEYFLDWEVYFGENEYFVGAIVGFVIVVAYIFTGGFVAVAWSDLFQGLIMLFCLVLLPIVAWLSVSGGDGMMAGLHAIDPNLTSIWGTTDGLTLLNLFTVLGLMLIGLGFMGSPQVFVRFMSIKDENEIRKGRWVAIVFTFLTDSAAVLIGMVGRYIFTGIEGLPDSALGSGAENVLPMLVEHVMPLTLVGLYIAAVLAAIMSTIDSLLVLASSAVSRDFYQKIFNPGLSDAGLSRFSRMATLAMALIALAISMTVAMLSPDRTIFWFVIFGWSGIAATFCPMMILSLFWGGYNEKGAIASMVTGFLCVPLFKFVVPEIAGIADYVNALGELPPSFLMSAVMGIVVSRATQR